MTLSEFEHEPQSRPVPAAAAAPVLVRPGLPGDDEALARLDRATWSTLHAVDQPPQPPFFRDGAEPEDHLVAVVDGALVGYLRLGRPTPLAANSHVRQVNGLAVATEARGRGIARALLRAAVTETRRRGANRLTLRVLGHNTPARCLYEAEGFAVEGVLPGELFLDGQYVDDILMGRSV